MSKTKHGSHDASGPVSPARSRARIAVSLLALVFASAILSSCYGMWTALNNPVDPVACEVDTPEYWRVFDSDDTYPSSYDPVLESLRYSGGYQVLYLGMNDGTYTYGDVMQPFVMITTMNTAQEWTSDGNYYSYIPIIEQMTITDSNGVIYDPWENWPQHYKYVATDGVSYEFYVTTFGANQYIDRTRTYYVSINPTYVASSDGTPLSGTCYFTVVETSNGGFDPSDVSIGAFDGISTGLSCDFSANDPYWDWSKGSGSGSVDASAGRYNLFAKSKTDPSGYDIWALYCKRYPFEIPEGTSAARVTCAFPNQTISVETGLYLSDEKGSPVAAIKIDPFGWITCYGPGSSTGSLRKNRQGSLVDFDYASTTLAIRQDGGTLYFYLNGNCFAFCDRGGNKITNAGLFIVGQQSTETANAIFDDFMIAY